jgi:acyl carrier protein
LGDIELSSIYTYEKNLLEKFLTIIDELLGEAGQEVINKIDISMSLRDDLYMDSF